MNNLLIKTARCTLRRFEEKDLDAFMSYRNDEAWMKFQGFKNLTKEAYREALLVPLNLEEGVQLAIADNSTGELLGDLYLAKNENVISVGYTIDPKYARKGYIIEALEVLLPAIKTRYPECEIKAMTDKDNIPSKKLLMKAGFVYEKWVEEWQEESYIWNQR